MEILDNFLATSERAREIDKDICFIIAKSDNKNIVTYSCQLQDDKFPTEKPLKKRWQAWEEIGEDGNPTIYELTHLEKKLGYGQNYLTKTESEVKFTIIAYDKLTIRLVTENNKIVTRLLFSGMDYYLLGIYVHLEETIVTKIRPRGITLIVKISISEPGTDKVELSPAFNIYINTKININ